jgi:hypothetical protein
MPEARLAELLLLQDPAFAAWLRPRHGSRRDAQPSAQTAGP